MLVALVLWLLSPIVKIESTFTPMRIALAGTHHYYSSKKARSDFSCVQRTDRVQAQRDMGYKPLLSVDEALRLTIASYPEYHNKTK
jgi:sterol-4alpha-carboxylate 3-dehydrogenase (decarboxylating)